MMAIPTDGDDYRHPPWSVAKLGRRLGLLPADVRRALVQLCAAHVAEPTDSTGDHWRRVAHATARGCALDRRARRVASALSLPPPLARPFLRSVYRRPDDNGGWYPRKPVGR